MRLFRRGGADIPGAVGIDWLQQTIKPAQIDHEFPAPGEATDFRFNAGATARAIDEAIRSTGEWFEGAFKLCPSGMTKLRKAENLSIYEAKQLAVLMIELEREAEPNRVDVPGASCGGLSEWQETASIQNSHCAVLAEQDENDQIEFTIDSTRQLLKQQKCRLR